MKSLMHEFQGKFDQERARFNLLMSRVRDKGEELHQVEKQYNNLVNFIETKSNAHLLSRIKEINSFIHGTNDDLKRTNVLDQNDLRITSSLTPLTINASRAVEAIGKFNLLPSRSDSNPPKTFHSKPPLQVFHTGNQSQFPTSATNSPFNATQA